MSYPAEGIESAYKNNIDDVREFLETKYPENYIVVNVSPRSYRMERLHDRVRAQPLAAQLRVPHLTLEPMYLDQLVNSCFMLALEREGKELSCHCRSLPPK